MTLADAIDTTVVRTARIWENREIEKIKGGDQKAGAEKSRGTMKREFENWKSEVDPDAMRILEHMVEVQVG